MNRPRLLDLFCCQGGASRGYVDAGFDVVGVDIDPKPRYPYEFAQADAIAFFANHAHEFRAWHASPPCQFHTHPEHVARTTKMGRAPVEGEYMHIVGNFSGVERGREVMGMPWANRDGLREVIPPAYTEHIGRQLIQHLEQVAA